MALSFFIQEGVVSTTTKKTGLAQLFNVTAWLKFALKSLGVAYFDSCDTCAAPAYATAISSWTTSTRPTIPTGMIAFGFNKTTSKLEVWNGTAWVVLPAAMTV
jgi:hypothetical protein